MFDAASMFNKIVIDGTEVSIADLDAANGQTQLSEGEHTVKYTLKDPTFIGVDGDPSSFKVGAIFMQCTSIVSVSIPNSVTNIGSNAFNACSGLQSITSLATTPPYLGYDAFYDITNNCPIYVPSESVEAYKTANNWSTYASRIQAIPTA